MEKCIDAQSSSKFWEEANRPPAANTGGNWVRAAAGCLRGGWSSDFTHFKLTNNVVFHIN